MADVTSSKVLEGARICGERRPGSSLLSVLLAVPQQALREALANFPPSNLHVGMPTLSVAMKQKSLIVTLSDFFP